MQEADGIDAPDEVTPAILEDVDAPAADAPADPAPGGTRRRDTIVFLALLFAYGFFVQVPAWNEYSRYDLTRAIVEDGTTIIDPYADNTGDKATRDGHWYSDKAPGTSLITVPAYAALLAIADATGRGTPPPDIAVAVLVTVACALLSAFLALLLLRFLRTLVGEVWALVVTAGWALGTIAFPFATMFFGHAMAAFFLFATFFVLWQARRRGAGASAWLPVLAGFLAGWAILADVSAVFGLLVLGLYAALGGARRIGRGPGLVRRLDVATPLLMAAGGLAPVVVLFAYNTISFGSPLSLGYSNLQAGGFASGMSQGILGVTMPKPDVMADLLWGPRGLLRLSPWLALAPLGLVALRQRAIRAEVAVAAAMCVGFLLFNAGYYLPFGGWTPGPRFLVPALPFAAILVAVAPRRVRPLTALLIVVSIALVFIATVTQPNAPEAVKEPLTDLWLPRFLAGTLAQTTAFTAWGLEEVAALAVLLLGLALAEAGIVATFSTGRVARAVSTVSIVGLVAFVLAFSMPILPWGAVTSAVVPQASRGLEIVRVSATPETTDGKREFRLRALLHSSGETLLGSKVRFLVEQGNGTLWVADVLNQAWYPGDWRVATVVWNSTEIPPGDYRWFVRVVSTGDPDVVFVERSPAGTIRLP